MMACEYCTFKIPKENAVYTSGKYPVGKPLVVNRDEFYRNYIILTHRNGCKAIPDEDHYTITFYQYGTGFYSKINYCPMCGRKLEDTNEHS